MNTMRPKNLAAIRRLVLLALMAISVVCGSKNKEPPPGNPPGNQKYLTMSIWTDHGGNDLDNFKDLVDTAKAKGLNAISPAIAWWRIEPADDVFDFSWFDQRVDYVVQQGLKLNIRLFFNGYPDWIGPQFKMLEEDGTPAGPGGRSREPDRID